MEQLKRETLLYLDEEIRQCKLILNGVINQEYRAFITKKIRIYEYIFEVIKKSN